jgi:hypothetical protein
MKVSKIQTSQGFRVKNNKSLGIQNYDLDNNYPQKVDEIVRASGSGLSCVRTYARFVYGHGFNDTRTGGAPCNKKGETFDSVLKKACRDYTMYHGFALHVNYNAQFKVSELQHVPFEHCRFSARDKETGHFDRVAVYDDWTRRDSDRKQLKKDDIDFIDLYNSNPIIIARQVEASGGWGAYMGQIYYYSGAGDKVYPAPIFEAELTNMRTEEGIDNVVGRNVTCNFLPGVIIVDINNSSESDAQFKEMQDELARYQSDENAGNIMLTQVRSRDEIPETIELKNNNYDKEFSATQAYLPLAIGRAFSQPPILRAENVTTGFSTDEMLNAYKFYNTQTEDDRQNVSNVFSVILREWHTPAAFDTTIMPLSYNTGASRVEQIGLDATRAITELIANPQLTRDQKIKVLVNLYDFDEVDVIGLVGNPTPATINNNPIRSFFKFKRK